MKGIILKDLFFLDGAYRRNIILVIILYATFYLAMKQTFFLYAFIVLIGFYTLGTFTSDETSGWNRYARTLPLTPGQIVGSKYWVSLLFLIVSVLFSLLLAWIGQFFFGFGELTVIFYTSLIMAALSLLIISFLFPAALKWGVEKARNTMMVVWFLLFFIIITLGKQYREQIDHIIDQIFGQLTLAHGNQIFPLFILGFCLVGILAYWISFLVSRSIWIHKEF